uniref:C2H2-type domain-containing protein n=1 Tax=Panagrellus redivivus TaxID=6233 RepID=A0A7E4ZZU8_PANRE
MECTDWSSAGIDHETGPGGARGFVPKWTPITKGRMKRRRKATSREGSEIDANYTSPSTSDSKSPEPILRRSLRKSTSNVRNSVKRVTRSSISNDVKEVKKEESESSTSSGSESEGFVPSKPRNRRIRAQTCPPRKPKENLNKTIGEVIQHTDSSSDEDGFKCPRCHFATSQMNDFKSHIGHCFATSDGPADVTDEIHTCPKCPYRNRNLFSVESHTRKCDGKFKDEFTVDPYGTPKCLACKRKFPSLQNVFRHLRFQSCKRPPGGWGNADKDVRMQPIGPVTPVLQNEATENVEPTPTTVDTVTPRTKRKTRRVSIDVLPEVSESPETRGSEVAEMPPRKRKPKRSSKRATVSGSVEEVEGSAVAITSRDEAVEVNGADREAISRVDEDVGVPKLVKRKKKRIAENVEPFEASSEPVEAEVAENVPSTSTNFSEQPAASSEVEPMIESDFEMPKSKKRKRKAPIVESSDDWVPPESTSEAADENPPTPKSPKRKKRKQTVNDGNPDPPEPPETPSTPPFFQLLTLSPRPTVSPKKQRCTPTARDAKNRPLHKCPDCEYQTINTTNLRRHIRLVHKKESLSWLSVVDKQGKVIPEGAVAATAIDKTTAMSAGGPVDKVSKFTCKYCDNLIFGFDYLSHLTIFHLDVRGVSFPNIYTMHPNAASYPLGRLLPESDDYPIDFSRIVQDDPCLQISRKTYDTMFHIASNSDSQQLDAEYDRFFAYTVTSNAASETYYHYTCPSCSEKVKTITLPMLQIAVIAHIGLRHRKSRCLTFLVEQELSLFNSAFNTTFQICPSFGSGPLLAHEFELKDDEFFVAQCYGIGNVEWDSKSFVCRQCFLVFPRFCDFMPHLEKVHGITKRHRMTLVEPWKILDRRDRKQRTNRMEQFAFSIDEGGHWMWVCYDCNHFVTAPTPVDFFTLVGVHLFPKVSTIEHDTRVLSWIASLFGGPIPTKADVNFYANHYAYLITNCRDLAANSPPTPPPSSPTSRTTHTCYFCGFTLTCPSEIAENVAVVIHIIQDHDDMMSNAALLSFMASSGTESLFPFLDPVFEGNLEKLKENRRLRCSICQCVFKSFKQLKAHAMLHLDESFDLDPKQYMFFMTTRRCKKLIYSIDGIGPNFEPIDLPSKSEKLYACLQCAEIFEDSLCLKFRIYEHIRQCSFPSKEAIPDTRDMPPTPKKKETSTSAHNAAWTYACPTCSKQYLREHAATCCASGSILSNEVAKEPVSPNQITGSDIERRVRLV